MRQFRLIGRKTEMIYSALRATSHVATWLIWHSTGVSLLADLDRPRPPHPEQP